MQNPFRNIAHVALILVLLVFTSGASVISHYCPATGKKDISMSTQSHCCGSDASADSEGCCEVDQQLVKADFVASKLELSFEQSVFIVTALPALYEILLQELNEPTQAFPNLPPPPRSGREISILHQSFLI